MSALNHEKLTPPCLQNVRTEQTLLDCRSLLLTATNLAVVHEFKNLFCVTNRYQKVTPPIKMQSSSNAEEAKVYFAIFTFVLFDNNSMCLIKSQA